MNDIPAPAPLAPIESFTSPEAAQAEYKRYAHSPEYQQAASSPHGKGPALARLEALGESGMADAWADRLSGSHDAPGGA